MSARTSRGVGTLFHIILLRLFVAGIVQVASMMMCHSHCCDSLALGLSENRKMTTAVGEIISRETLRCV